VSWWGWGVGGCFSITCAAASFAYSLFNSTCLFKMSSALSMASSSFFISSSATIYSGAVSGLFFTTDFWTSLGAACWDCVYIYARSSAFALLRVVFAGGCGLSVGGGMVLGYGA
jgi:hypothetical protein